MIKASTHSFSPPDSLSADIEEKDLQTLLAVGTIGWETDCVSRMTAYSHEARNKIRTRGQLSLAAWIFTTHQDDRERVRKVIGNALSRGGPFFVTYRTLSEKGTERWRVTIGTPRLDHHGAWVGYTGVTMDSNSASDNSSMP